MVPQIERKFGLVVSNRDPRLTACPVRSTKACGSRLHADKTVGANTNAVVMRISQERASSSSDLRQDRQAAANRFEIKMGGRVSSPSLTIGKVL